MTYYHGTACSLEPGTLLTADGARRADPSYPAHIRHVWATTLPLVAASHATKNGGPASWDTGHVYEVEPIASDVEPDPMCGSASWRSPSGFRVVRRVGSPAELWAR
jgi:hypothetical protein